MFLNSLLLWLITKVLWSGATSICDGFILMNITVVIFCDTLEKDYRLTSKDGAASQWIAFPTSHLPSLCKFSHQPGKIWILPQVDSEILTLNFRRQFKVFNMQLLTASLVSIKKNIWGWNFDGTWLAFPKLKRFDENCHQEKHAFWLLWKSNVC